MKYVFKNKFLVILFSSFDTLGSIVFLPLRFKPAPVAPKRIVIVRLDHMGDFIATTPLVRLLKEKYPCARISVVVDSSLLHFAQTYPYIDEVIGFEASWFKRPKVKVKQQDVKALSAKLKEGKFDIAIDPRGDYFSICAMYRARIPFRIGYGITGGGFLLHREVRLNPNAGVIERNMAVLSSLGISVDAAKQLPDVFFSQSDKEHVERVLTSLNVADAKAVVLHPFAGTLAKQWAPDKFQELVNMLRSQGKTIFVIGTKKDTHSLRNIVDLRGEFSLNELSFLIERTGLFIGLDSGPAHIAIATKTASVIICSGTNTPELWLPQAPFAKLIYHAVTCKPCSLTVCPKPKHYCMEDISVEEVLKALQATPQV
jgi:heptosyltransferase-2